VAAGGVFIGRFALGILGIYFSRKRALHVSFFVFFCCGRLWGGVGVDVGRIGVIGCFIFGYKKTALMMARFFCVFFCV